jgi:hypothetical protein
MLNEMIKKTNGSSEALSMILGDARAIRGAFVLAKNSGAQFNEELALMQNAAGATDTALSFQEQGLAYQLKILGNNVDAVGIKLGEKVIPELAKITDWLMNTGLPAFEGFISSIEPLVRDIAENYIGPLVSSVGELFDIFANGEGNINLLALALEPLKIALQAIKIVIDAIVAGLKLIGVGGGLKTQKLDRAAAGAGYSGGPRATGTPMSGGGGGGGGGSSYLQVNNSITLGRDATSSVNTQLGRAAKARGGKRTP